MWNTVVLCSKKLAGSERDVDTNKAYKRTRIEGVDLRNRTYSCINNWYAPSIRDMLSLNITTPYYAEDSTYTKGDLEQHIDAFGVFTLLYLQTLFFEQTGITF